MMLRLLHRLYGACRLRRTAIALLHYLVWAAGFGVALVLRYEGDISTESLAASELAMLFLASSRLLIFAVTGLFDGLFRYSGFDELRRIVVASASPTLFLLVAGPALIPGLTRVVLVAEWLVSIVAVGGMRMAVRAVYERSRSCDSLTPTLVVGANDAGEGLVRELQRGHGMQSWKVVGFLDESGNEVGARIHGLPVLGPATEQAVRKAVAGRGVEQVIFALQEVATQRTRELVAACRRLGLRTLVLPSLAERMRPGEQPTPVREIALEDLLGREPVRLDLEKMAGLIEDRVVLVTGAGGSIGSELARQVLAFRPRTLLLVEHDENALFFIERELRPRCGQSGLFALAGDITDRDRMEFVFERFAPDVVLHAAAHKHVAMMEMNACEAARNNVLGTRVLAELAHEARCSTFVLISTDKAVNPSSVMGATKRVCEMIVQHIARRSHTRFAAVRFGNVLGSNGSVVPLFREQIARGGPVTVTHPEVTRFFMTIPEAAGLVLQAAALGATGTIFLLDMGKPVKILELARALIELSGLRPGVDIPIEFIGLKPGEKLQEELLLGEETTEERPHPKIVVGRVRAAPALELELGLRDLNVAIRSNDDAAVRLALQQLVPEARLDATPVTMRAPATVTRLVPLRSTLERAVSAGGELK